MSTLPLLLGSWILHPLLSLTYANNPVNIFNIHDTLPHFLQMTKPHNNLTKQEERIWKRDLMCKENEKRRRQKYISMNN